MNSSLDRFELRHPRGSTLHLAGPGSLDAGLELLTERLAGRRAVGSFYQRSVERNALGRRIEKELDRIITWLAMDIDGARVAGRAAVVGPPIVRLPAI